MPCNESMKKYTKLTIKEASLLAKVTAYFNSKLDDTHKLTLDINRDYFSMFLFVKHINKYGRYTGSDIIKSWSVVRACDMQQVFSELVSILPKYC